MNVKEYETSMWEAAKNRDREGFMELVDENAVMVCGGYLSGALYDRNKSCKRRKQRS